jgi:hypothetical protein
MHTEPNLQNAMDQAREGNPATILCNDDAERLAIMEALRKRGCVDHDLSWTLGYGAGTISVQLKSAWL